MAINKLTEFSRTGDKNTDDLNLEAGFPVRLQPARQWMNWLFNSLTKKVNEIIEAIESAKTYTDQKSDEAIESAKTYTDQKSDESIGLISICPFLSIPSNYLECDGVTLSISNYPELFAKIGTIYGGNGSTNFKLPDLRGEFVRGLDNGRDIDASRAIGSHQNDAMQNITGTFTGGFGDRSSGAFSKKENGDGQAGTASPQSVFDFDASRQVRTATETRPRNIAMIYVIKVI